MPERDPDRKFDRISDLITFATQENKQIEKDVYFGVIDGEIHFTDGSYVLIVYEPDYSMGEGWETLKIWYYESGNE